MTGGDETISLPKPSLAELAATRRIELAREWLTTSQVGKGVLPRYSVLRAPVLRLRNATPGVRRQDYLELGAILRPLSVLTPPDVPIFKLVDGQSLRFC